MANKSSRRDFVKRSAALVAGAIVLPQIIPSSALEWEERLPPSDRIVMGTIGTGSQGMSNMRDFLRLKDAGSVCCSFAMSMQTVWQKPKKLLTLQIKIRIAEHMAIIGNFWKKKNLMRVNCSS